ncbi:MAG: enoyl-CoA hydratase-related protein [Solirubrobacteraceae bacterium]|nr:enoyl-CoA hydratase-related protein [Solirubrobacteraceae bacterium]
MSTDAPGEPILLEVADGIARLTLDRPDAGNAIDPPWASTLRRHAEALAARDDVRVVLLTARGRAFCVGGALGYFAESGDGVGDALHALASELHAGILALQALDAPLVVAVGGAAAGAGLSLVAAADLVVASPAAKFAAAYTGAGLSPDGGQSWFLPRVVGLRRATEMLLTNRRLGADEALEWGLVNRVVPADELDAAAGELARTLAAGPTAAYGATRRLLRDGAAARVADQLDAEADAIAANGAHPDGREGVAAFLAKRAPTFRG